MSPKQRPVEFTYAERVTLLNLVEHEVDRLADDDFFERAQHHNVLAILHRAASKLIEAGKAA